MAAKAPCMGSRSTAKTVPTPDRPINTLQRLLDLYNTAPAAANLITSLLPKPTQSAVFGSCRAGRELVRQVVTEVVVDVDESGTKCPDFLDFYPNCTSLVLRGIWNNSYSALVIMKSVAKRCRAVLGQLVSVKLQGIVHDGNQGGQEWSCLVRNGLRYLLQQCTSLRVLELSNMSDTSDMEHQNVTLSLQLPVASPDREQVLRDVLPGSKAEVALPELIAHPPFKSCLTRLVMPNITFGCDRNNNGGGQGVLALHDAIMGATNLRHLEMEGTSVPDNSIGRLIGSPLPQLTTLNFNAACYNPIDVEDDEFERCFKALNLHSQLRELRFLSDTLPLNSLQLASLRRLEISGDTRMSRTLEGLSSLASLQELVLWHVYPHVDWGHQVLAPLQPLKHLHTLHLTFAKYADTFGASDMLHYGAQVANTQGMQLFYLPALKTVVAEHVKPQQKHSRRVGQSLLNSILEPVIAPGLTSLQASLAPIHAAELLDRFPSLDLSKCEGLQVEVDGGAELLLTATRWPQLLARPGLVSHSNLRAYDIVHLGRVMNSELLHLDISSSRVIGWSTHILAILVSTCPRLKLLGVMNDFFLTEHHGGAASTEAGYKSISKGLPSLQHLRLLGCEGVKDASVMELIKG